MFYGIVLKDRMIIEYEDDEKGSFRQMDSIRYRKTFTRLSSKLISSKEKEKDRLSLLCGPTKRARKDHFQLKKLIQKNKVNGLVKNFANKMNHLRVHSTAIDIEEPYDESHRLAKWLRKTQGYTLSSYSLIAWNIVNIIQITAMVFVFSIMLAFPETQNYTLFLYLTGISIALYAVDMLLNFIIQVTENGKDLKKLWNIGSKYMTSGFAIDLLSLIVFPISLIPQIYLAPVSLLIAIIKLAHNISKFETYEYLIIPTEKEHHYGLVKVFVTNFVIGHFLSIFLNLMANLQTGQTWYNSIDIGQKQWFAKYIWGYYWGTNIMLTVGFGDLTATTQIEAAFLVFIQIFSCIILAYNISNVGALIAQIRQNGQKKKKKLKIFHRMSKDNDISSQLVGRVNNHIKQSFEIKQQFEFNQYDSLLDQLPKNLRSQYRKQANNYLFDNIGFLTNMSKKTLLVLAEAVQRKIAHPQQIFKKKGQVPQFMVLEMGEVGFACRNKSSILTGRCFDYVSVKTNDKPKVLSLDFIKGKLLEYDLKSIGYSVLYRLEIDEFARYLRQIEMDFQLFCTIRDRDEYILNQNEVYPCQVCKVQYHTKFKCSKLHFIPLKQHVVDKYLHQEKLNKQYRDRSFFRKIANTNSWSPIKNFQYHQQKAFQFLQSFLNDRDFQQTRKIRRAYELFVCRKQRNEKRQSLKNRHSKIFSHFSKSDSPKELFEKIQSLFRKAMVGTQTADQSWKEQVDAVQNYRYYFPNYNILQIAFKYPRFVDEQEIEQFEIFID